MGGRLFLLAFAICSTIFRCGGAETPAGVHTWSKLNYIADCCNQDLFSYIDRLPDLAVLTLTQSGMYQVRVKAKQFVTTKKLLVAN